MTVEDKLVALLKAERFRKSNSEPESYGYRNPFESDYFRIVTSAPFRRLQDKTQIFPQEKSDFVRRRLTHSMEVATIGRRIGLMIEEELIKRNYISQDGEYVNKYSHSLATILETAGLVHDIGNPPFGHFGEDTIQQYFCDLLKRSKLESSIEAAQLTFDEHIDDDSHSTAVSLTRLLFKEQQEIGLVARMFASLPDEQKSDFLHFDGNVEGFRILRHLGLSADDNSFNLTMPTLATIIKYPQASKDIDKKSKVHSKTKYGDYVAENNAYEDICQNLHLCKGHRHPLAYLLEAADDIANVTSDVEDGFKMGTIPFEKMLEELKDFEIDKLRFDNIAEFLKNQGKSIDPKLKEGTAVFKELQVKEFRIRAVSVLIEKVVEIFVENFENIVNDAYDNDSIRRDECDILGQELLKDNSVKNMLKELQSCSFSAPSVLKSEILGKNVITELMNMFVGCMFSDDIQKKEEEESIILGGKTLEGKLYALISPNFKRAVGCEKDEVPKDHYQRFLLAVDHVANMTDSYAVDLYNELTNRKR